MKKLNKKGFTIVELVIVISVIAILSAVMIPTFVGIVNKSKKSAAAQEADTAFTAVLTAEDAQLNEEKTYYFISGDYWFKHEEGKLVDTTAPADLEADADDVIYTENGTLPADAPITIDFKTDAAGADTTETVIAPTALEDLGSVIVWVD